MIESGAMAERGTGLGRRIVALAWPVLVGQWALMAYGVMDTIMAGHASSVDLAAMALGASIYASVFVGLMGVVLALNPVIAQHFGGERYEDIGKAYAQGLWLCVWLTIIGTIVMGYPDAWLFMSEVSPAVHDKVSHYLYALVFALPATLLFRSAYAFNTAISRPKVIMSINLAGLFIKLPLNWILVFGKFGVPAMGATGCGVATAIVMWLSCALVFVIMRRDSHYRRFALHFAWPQWERQKELLRIGIPMGLSYLVEVTSFTFMALLVARLGISVTGGHQITGNLGAICYMLPLSLSVATSTLTAQALGAGDPRAALRTVRTGIRITVGIAIVTASILFFARPYIIAAYTDDPQVVVVAMSLTLYLVGFHVFDALQTVAGFALRAYKHTVAPMLIYTVCLWGVGLIGGYWVAFHPVFGAPMGAEGLWASATVSLLVAALALLFHLSRVGQRKIAEADGLLHG